MCLPFTCTQTSRRFLAIVRGGCPRALSAHRWPGAGAGPAPVALPGPAFASSRQARSPSPEPPEDAGKKIPSCKNKHGSPTCFYTGSQVPCSFVLSSAGAFGRWPQGRRRSGIHVPCRELGCGPRPPGSERLESCPRASWGRNMILAYFPDEGRHVGSPLWCHPGFPASLPGSGLCADDRARPALAEPEVGLGMAAPGVRR